jgi:hypothetical protein
VIYYRTVAGLCTATTQVWACRAGWAGQKIEPSLGSAQRQLRLGGGLEVAGLAQRQLRLGGRVKIEPSLGSAQRQLRVGRAGQKIEPSLGSAQRQLLKEET